MLELSFFFFSRRRRHTRYWRDLSSDVCSSDLPASREFQIVHGKRCKRGHRIDAQIDDWGRPLKLRGSIGLLGLRRQTGRAPCGERGRISVAAESLKKKNI